MATTDCDVRIMTRHLNLYKQGWWVETRMRRAARSFFQQLLQEEEEYEFLVLRVLFPRYLTTEAIRAMLEAYGVCGVCGQVDPILEWEFWIPTAEFALPTEKNAVLQEITRMEAGVRGISSELTLADLEREMLNETPWRTAYFIGKIVSLLMSDDTEKVSSEDESCT